MIRVTLPLKVTNPLNGQMGISRGAMFRKAAERKEQRRIAGLAVRAALNETWVAPPYVITLMRVAPSEGLDEDNLMASMKSVRDGVTDALGLKNDRDPILTWKYDQWHGRPKHYAVVVEIEARGERA